MRIVVDGQYSTVTKITRGIRQGCPLSPLLFSVCLEMMAVAIRGSSKMIGVRLPSKEYKLAQYADVVGLFFMINLVYYLPHLLKILQICGGLAGEVNQKKFEILVVDIK